MTPSVLFAVKFYSVPQPGDPPVRRATTLHSQSILRPRYRQINSMTLASYFDIVLDAKSFRATDVAIDIVRHLNGSCVSHTSLRRMTLAQSDHIWLS